jgi:hypothetical protein
VFETPTAQADRQLLGAHMGGGTHHSADANSQRMKTIAAQPLRVFDFALARTALVIIDMQRDFIEPGGFGATLGNDVSLLSAIVPTCQTPCLSAWREVPAAWWCTRVKSHQPRPVRLPACQAQLRAQPSTAHRRCRARWGASWWHGRARQPDHPCRTGTHSPARS